MKSDKVIFKNLSYSVVGLCFETHNELGKYCKEKQYGDALEKKLKEAHIEYKKELIFPGTRNIVDFLIEDKIILELKAKETINKDDYYQVQRYLQMLKIKLGILINFRSQYLRPKRIVRIDTESHKKFLYPFIRIIGIN
ncbi:MAG: GxxExxY protein [Patescibacteria group bacterium]|nr:GxxExxY protein [Patescibacteria group bacterium]MDD4304340.1 GxxExxY protein [Patescibacteria group bacterium]MDD4695603.1 GxxExxY protein [Patescibacteria group bacterium]